MWILQDLKSRVLILMHGGRVSVEDKGVTDERFVSVEDKGVRGIDGLQGGGGNQLSVEEGSPSTSLSAGSRLLWSSIFRPAL